METAERRLDRFIHLVPYLWAGAVLAALGLFAEWRLAGTLLLLPAGNWTSRRIPGGILMAPGGDYSVSFANTRLDWRLRARGRS